MAKKNKALIITLGALATGGLVWWMYQKEKGKFPGSSTETAAIKPPGKAIPGGIINQYLPSLSQRVPQELPPTIKSPEIVRTMLEEKKKAKKKLLLERKKGHKKGVMEQRKRELEEKKRRKREAKARVKSKLFSTAY